MCYDTTRTQGRLVFLSYMYMYVVFHSITTSFYCSASLQQQTKKATIGSLMIWYLWYNVPIYLMRCANDHVH